MEKGKKIQGEGAGERFREETKYTPERLAGYTLDWDHVPEAYKNYDTPLARIPLPPAEMGGDPDIWGALGRRRSRRSYDRARTLAVATVSTLLWAAQGLTARYGGTALRTAPSAGGLYPIETYLHVRAVEGLDAGFYHFRPAAFDLEYLKKGDFSAPLVHAALGQALVGSAQATFIWSALIARSKWKYHERAYRYIYLDAGHIAENLYLAAEALGLGVCAIGAFFDDEMNGLLDLDGQEETVIYMAATGRPG